MMVDRGSPTGYDPTSFWESRLRGSFNLDGVGFRSLGKPFNAALYRRRLTVLDRALRRDKLVIADADIVKLAPGTAASPASVARPR